MLLKHLQSTDPGSLDLSEDDMCEGWGHGQFTAGDITMSTSLTSWQDIGSIATAFKLVVAALKTCQEAWLMCANARTPKTSRFISDLYLEKVIKSLESCWVGAGGVCFHTFSP